MITSRTHNWTAQMKWHSYHNHSTYSDGQNSMEEMLLAAKAAGVCEYGFSDHYIVTPWGKEIDWGIKLDALDSYVESVLALKKKYDSEDFTVRLGLEVDYFQENIDKTMAVLAGYPLDYIIGAVHFTDEFNFDTNADDWKPFSQEQINQVYATFWNKMKLAAGSGYFTILAHLDLPKKYDFRPTVDFTAEAEAVIQAAAAHHLATEINTAGWLKPCQEQYPEFSLIKKCVAAGLPIAISADAHATKNVIQGFDHALELLRKAGGQDPFVLS